MSLYNKYRPQTLKEMFGNDSTIKALSSVLSREQGMLPHSFLFTGSSGCGKTTLARIAAKKIGVKTTDFKEYDSASFRGIDTIREIVQIMRTRAIDGNVKAFLLDEVHQLTKDAQSALLKALEDTPPHVYFMLCTTDPQKLLPTIVGRCQKYTVELLNKDVMFALLMHVSKSEGVKVPEAVIKQIVQDANGSSRAALVTLDKIIDLPEKDMLYAAQESAYVENEAIELCRALFNKNSWKEVSSILRGLENADVERVRLAVLGYCNSILLKSDKPHAYIVMDCFKEPFDRNGKPGLTMACYEALNAK